MKDVSAGFIAEEEASTKKPTELYHLWTGGGDHWRYTNGDVNIVYDGETYQPATIQRSLVKYNAQLEVSTCTLQAAHIEEPFVRYIAINPVEVSWISISRLHRDLVPAEIDIIFIGQIRTVSFQGIQAQIECVGFEHFLNMPLPRFRYSVTCNWKLFESLTISGETFGCQLASADYKLSTAIALDATGRILTSADFGLQDDGYYTLGYVVYQNERRAIIAHEGNNITIAYRMRDLTTGEIVDAYPGCDGRPATCLNKFDNVANALFFPFIPQENPAVRTP